MDRVIIRKRAWGEGGDEEHQPQQLNRRQKQKNGEGEWLDEVELFKRVFEFPWKKVCEHIADDGCDFRDVFFSSLVDGSSAMIGLPGDRLAQSRPPFDLAAIDGAFTSRPSSESDVDGYDCIWGSLLQSPAAAVAAVAAKGPTA